MLEQSVGRPSLLERLWGLRRPRRLASVILRRIKLSHLFTIHTNGVVLRFFPAVWNRNLWENPNIFSADTTFLRRYLRPGDTLVDGGANVGLITLVGSVIVGRSGRIFSFEPHPRIYGYLTKNIELNKADNVTAFNVAIGEAESSVSFTDDAMDDGNHIAPAASDLSVPMKTLDEILPQVGPIALLKLDVEGYERYVLSGARGVLAKTECVYFESSEKLFNRYSYRCSDMFGDLLDAGFEILRIESDGRLSRLPREYSSANIENLFAVRNVDTFLARTGYVLGL
jgi:FkbM family methyltransferase